LSRKKVETFINNNELIVDDDKLVRMIHQGLLKRAGVKIEAVKNGKEAVDIHFSGQRFDIILMDKEIPIMNVIEVRSYIIIYVEM